MFRMQRIALGMAMACALAVALALPGTASAANITFGPSNNITGNPSDVSVSPGFTVDRAYWFGGQGDNTPVTINGVSFSNFENQGTDTSSGFGNQYGGYGSVGSDSGYNTLQANGIYQDGGSTSLTFNNLHAGDTYDLTVWVNDTRGCCTGRVLTVSGDSTTGAGTLNFGGGSGVNGQYDTGTFVATGTSQTLNIDVAPGSTSNNQINGVLLSYSSPVPEPASLTLLGLGGVGLVLARRRKLA